MKVNEIEKLWAGERTKKNAIVTKVTPWAGNFPYRGHPAYGTTFSNAKVSIRFDDGKEVSDVHHAPGMDITDFKVGDRVIVQVLKTSDAYKQDYKKYGVQMGDYQYEIVGKLPF